MLDSIKTALLSIWTNKVRSLLNIIGIVIGVASVTILIALGEGLKADVSGVIQDLGTNIIAITGGKIDPSDTSGQTNPANFITGDILTMEDVETLESLPSVEFAAPISLLPGSVKYQDKIAAPTLYGAFPNMLDALSALEIDKGQMFTSRADANVVVLGYAPTQTLFGTTNPIGKMVTIAGEEFEVIGTLAQAKSGSTVGSEFDSFTIVPFDTATRLNKNQVKIVRLLVKAIDDADVAAVKEEIKAALIENHDGEEDFTVLTQDDLLDLLGTFFDLATAMVSAIAAISLVVGGVGIMNIMLVTVTERTREIGLRKAVGATKAAILFQFLTEAIVVTAVGAMIGLIISFTASAIVSAYTDLNPIVSMNTILLSVGIAVVIGVIFGLWPAMRAANKDPIEALRYE